MPAVAELDHAERDEPEGSRLADEIARAMHHRPLMSRLARLETAFTPPAGTSAPALGRDPAFATAEPVPTSAAPPPVPQSEGLPATFAYSASIEELIADAADSVTTTPPSAEWLSKARSDRQRAKLRNVAAWLTTLAIAASIVGAALLMIRS